MEPWRAVFNFRDNNGAKAISAVYLPGGLSVIDAVSKMNAIATAMQALSNASLYAAQLEASFDFDSIIPAAIGSDVQTLLIAVYSNEVERRAIALPSPGALPYDVGGALRAIRLGYDAASLSGLLPSLQGIVEGTVTPWGTAAPDNYIVGGISRGVL